MLLNTTSRSRRQHHHHLLAKTTPTLSSALCTKIVAFKKTEINFFCPTFKLENKIPLGIKFITQFDFKQIHLIIIKKKILNLFKTYNLNFEKKKIFNHI